MLLKAVTVLAVSVMTAVIARKLYEQVEASKARVRVKAKHKGQGITRLRRDPVTGVYHPEA